MDYLASASFAPRDSPTCVAGLAITDDSVIRSWRLINGSPLWESRESEILTPVYSGKLPGVLTILTIWSSTFANRNVERRGVECVRHMAVMEVFNEICLLD